VLVVGQRVGVRRLGEHFVVGVPLAGQQQGLHQVHDHKRQVCPGAGARQRRERSRPLLHARRSVQMLPLGAIQGGQPP
jgi:hypothetical protein